MRRRLIRFILPVSVLLAILTLTVFQIFWALNPPANFPEEFLNNLHINNTRLFYAQLAVTVALLFAGWLRLLFLQPPTSFWVGGAPFARRPASLPGYFGNGWTIGSTGYLSIAPINEWLRITWLPRINDYLIIAGIVIIWALVLRLIWRLGRTLPRVAQPSTPSGSSNQNLGKTKLVTPSETGSQTIRVENV